MIFEIYPRKNEINIICCFLMVLWYLRYPILCYKMGHFYLQLEYPLNLIDYQTIT